MSIEYRVGQSLMWVPYHADDYDHQRLVKVVELRDTHCAKLDNGWIVDGFGECVSRDISGSGKVVIGNFTPSGYVEDCL